MTVDAVNAPKVHPFFAKRGPLKSTSKNDSNALKPSPAATLVVSGDKSDQPSKAPELPNSKPTRTSKTTSTFPAESSTTAAKRYARYRQELKERIHHEECQQAKEDQELSPMDQLLRDFYGCLLIEPEDDTIPPIPCYRPFKKGPAVWPDQSLFQGGHIHQLDNDNNFASKEAARLLNTDKERPEDRIRNILITSGSAYFTERRAWRTTMHRNSSPPNTFIGSNKQPKATVTLNRKKVEQLMDTTYKDWRNIPACDHLYTTLFKDNNDNGDDDNKDTHRQLSWPDKYRPKHVSNLLGNSKCYTFLAEWLHQSKVRSNKEEQKSKSKRAKVDKSKSPSLDFEQLTLGDSEDEGSSMEEDDHGNDDDDDFVMSDSRKRRQKREKKKKGNMILIVGPHGVGKTASIYTAAHEIGFDVFEINAASRRSGKDVLSAVGEMSDSHQVNFAEGSSKEQFANLALMFEAETKKRQLQEEQSKYKAKKRKTQQEQMNNKGSIMNHFAKIPKTIPSEQETAMAVDEPQDKPIDTSHEKNIDDKVEENDDKKDQQPSTPKQSLILIEEADVLYEEDKGFWSTVIDLAQRSKRPIIITCNDDDLIPAESLLFEKVIRVHGQHRRILAPYLQLLCLKEGYIIDPFDLVHLIASIGNDLRQLIQTLEVWCKQPDVTVPETHSNKKQRTFITCPRVFAQYMDLDDNGNMGEFSKDDFWNKIDMPLLSQLYTDKINHIKPKANNIAEAMWANDIKGVMRALDTACFVDSYIYPTHEPGLQQVNSDQLAGYSGSLCTSEHADAALQDLGSTIMTLSNKRLKNRKWQQEIRQGAATWGELCDIRTTTFHECSDASMRLLNWRLAANPVRSNVMPDYIPAIRAMCREEQAIIHARRKRRPARRKRNWVLDEDSIATLTRDRAITNTTRHWHEHAIKYAERWHKSTTNTG
ncbi:P-loop containing nucleoside triphosphate hydrolase protein [Lichtheimia hyalospora FSU 10163]|nr:P-loop containing nucleoside triphosphate hydrolase protein [Lichtheimia hyalospora FSU 10163]